MKYQFEFDILKLLRYYEKSTNKKLGESIERDITNSFDFVMFILERNRNYLEKYDSIYKKEGITFHNGNHSVIGIIEEYIKELNRKYSITKDVFCTENYIECGDIWKLHLVYATEKKQMTDT